MLELCLLRSFGEQALKCGTYAKLMLPGSSGFRVQGSGLSAFCGDRWNSFSLK